MCMRPSDILDSAVVAQGGHVKCPHDTLRCSHSCSFIYIIVPIHNFCRCCCHGLLNSVTNRRTWCLQDFWYMHDQYCVSLIRHCSYSFFYFCCFLLCRDRTKAWNGLRNGLKNRLIKLMICSPLGCGKSFHSCGLISALLTRTSMQVSPPAPLCAAS